MQHTHFAELIDAIAEKWRKAGVAMPLAQYACWHCSESTGIPDYEHFLSCELRNPRHVIGSIETVPETLQDELGLSETDIYQAHEEIIHKTVKR
ncbi:MAG: hypothetical protein IKN64_04800 [Desulfovibrio sp.]|nr:hypothetical protein [Desulfovibrio sp.]